MRDEAETFDQVVIGGGIIGLASAYYLAREGQRVVMVESGEIAGAASRGNAAALAFADIFPLASPGILLKAPQWLLDPLGPLAIPLREFPAMLPWLLQFFRASLPDRIRASIEAQASLMKLAKQEMGDLIASAGLADFIKSDGALELYESEGEWRSSLGGWAQREAHNIAFRHLNRAELDELQPGLSPQFSHATFIETWQTVREPREFALALFAAAEALGVVHVPGKVVGIAEFAGGAQVKLADGQHLEGKTTILAAGPWSGALASELGDRLPVIAERGYNTTLPPGAFNLERQLIFGGHGFVITPLSTGIRIGGASELARFEAPTNFKRSQHMLGKAARFLPGLKTNDGVQWMGSRPSMPDTLPVIGRSPSCKNIIYAFGHGHLGLTQSAATGRLVSDLALDRSPAISVYPFRPERF